MLPGSPPARRRWTPAPPSPIPAMLRPSQTRGGTPGSRAGGTARDPTVDSLSRRARGGPMARRAEAVPESARKTPEEIERHWFETVYQGDRMRQLTPRAIVMGMLLGMIMACSNVYVGLKAGWSMGVAI